MRNSLTNWVKKHIFLLVICFVLFCFLLGLMMGIVATIEDGSPLPIFLRGGTSLVISSFIGAMILGIAKMLVDLEEKLKK